MLRAILTAQTLLISSCSDTLEPVDGGFDDSANYSAGTGDGDVGSGALDPGECIADAKPTGDVHGYRHQCSGHFITHVGFSHAGEAHTIFIPAPAHIPFGDDHDSYDAPKVMACCGPIDDDLPLAQAPVTYAENCLLDFRQQACLSLATGLAVLIDDGTIPAVHRGKAIEVQHYLAQHTDACIAGLMADGSNSPTLLLGARWQLPANGPWSPALDDVHVMIDYAAITDIHLPAQPLDCTDLNDNNDNVFTPP